MFSGRINRLGYALGHLYLHIPSFIFIFIYALIRSAVDTGSEPSFTGAFNGILLFVGLVWAFFYLCVLLDLNVRRLHDLNQSGIYAALFLIPLVNFALFIVLLVVPGSLGQNRYGYPVSGFGIKRVLFNK